MINLSLPSWSCDFCETDKRYNVAYGGRAGGKSSTFCRIALLFMINEKCRILFAREIMNSIAQSSHRNLKDIIFNSGLSDLFTITNNSIINKKTGSEIIYKGLNRNSHNIKSLENIKYVFIDEAQQISSESWEYLRPTIRAKGSKIFISFNPRFKIDTIASFFNQEIVKKKSLIKKVLYSDNPFISSEILEEYEISKKTNPVLHKNIWYGEYLDDIDNPLALFSINNINKNRIPSFNLSNAVKIVIGLDPAGSTNKNSDETGIVVVALANDERVYILEDCSGKYTPNQWSSKLIALYDKYGANKIVAEKNYGGDMVENTIKTQAKILGRYDIKVKVITSTRSKIIRAEPISSLYENNKVSHVGYFPELEQQMITYNGDVKQKSPDRLDGLVFAITDLKVNKQNNIGIQFF